MYWKIHHITASASFEPHSRRIRKWWHKLNKYVVIVEFLGCCTFIVRISPCMCVLRLPSHAICHCQVECVECGSTRCYFLLSQLSFAACAQRSHFSASAKNMPCMLYLLFCSNRIYRVFIRVRERCVCTRNWNASSRCSLVAYWISLCSRWYRVWRARIQFWAKTYIKIKINKNRRKKLTHH